MKTNVHNKPGENTYTKYVFQNMQDVGLPISEAITIRLCKNIFLIKWNFRP